MQLELNLRISNQNDGPFLRSAWFESMWKGYAKPAGVSFEVYEQHAGDYIERALSRAALVASPRGNDAHICGFAVFFNRELHFVYTRAIYRRLGIAQALLSNRVDSYVNTAYGHGRPLVQKLALEFNPFARFT